MIDVNPNLASTILAFLGVLTFVILVGLSCCLFYYCSDGNYSAVFKGPKNRLLLLLIASSIGYFVSAAIYTRHEADLDSPLLAKSCLFALTLILYLAYTWLRTNDIFRTHSTPHILTFFKTLTITTCIVCLLPPSILLLPLPNATKNLAYNITAATNIFFASLLDGYFAYACLQQIFETSKECNTNERGALYHPLIARYGFLSSISTLGSSLCYAGYAIMGGLVPDSSSIDSNTNLYSTQYKDNKQTLQQNNQHNHAKASRLFGLVAHLFLFGVPLSLAIGKIKLLEVARLSRRIRRNQEGREMEKAKVVA